MTGGLKKKVGPLPIYAWALILGGVIGAIILMRRSGEEESPTAGYDVGSDTAGTILDPTTGQRIASEGGGGSLVSSTAPTLSDQIGAVTGTIGALQEAGLWPSVATQGAAAPSLIQLAPGQRYYDPLTGDTVDGPEAAAQDNRAGSAASQTPKKSAATPLERAKKVVQTGKVGRINRGRLIKAGYTKEQIDYHARRKTPLGQPEGKSKKKTTPKKAAQKQPKTARATATHPNQHRTAAPPNHAKVTRVKPRKPARKK